jgi:hypothetical protein
MADVLLAVFGHCLDRPSAEALKMLKACALVNRYWSDMARSLVCDLL